MADKPLAGIRIADFTWVWAGPFCTQQLAYLGADVIRVETTERPCVTRMLPPYADFQMGVNRSGYFNQYNQGKRSITLNMKHPRAIEIARRLVAASDIVSENFAYGVMERMGLGYEDLKKLRADVVMISLSGYGRSGPEKEHVSYGPATVPLSGFSAITGYADHPPMHVGISYGDPTAALHGAFAVLAALHHRALTGDGQRIDLSLWETSAAMLGDAILDYEMNDADPPRRGNRVRHLAPNGVFRSAGEDRWVALTAKDDAEWRTIAGVIGLPELAGDARFATLAARKENEDALEAILGEWTATRSPEEATARLQAAGIAAYPAMTNQNLYEDPHLVERDFFVELPHAEVGTRKHAGIPWKHAATPCRVERPAPLVGEHTREVLGGMLGYSASEIDELAAAGALR